jgi:DNA (cytosine-5)-methyltransferase 1|tara:strand:+ start:54 stop:1184 length:1131 start_codon:yes stop_codon:yes gene_type:complete
MNHLDLFSGIGGFSLGLKRVFNIKHTYFSEIDKYATDVYKYNFKNSTYVGSITDVRGTQLPRINIITFGSPCQDFSLAGKRKGMDGARSSLILEAIRLIKECKPDFFIWENVKGTFSSNSGADFSAILKAFVDIGGYRLEWQLLNTKWFLPQNRERIYLVGCLGKGSGQQIFPITKNNRQINELQRQQANTCTLTTRYEAGGNGSYIIERKLKEKIKIKSATKKGYEIAEQGDSVNYSAPSSKTRRGRVGKGIAQTLDTGCNQAVISDFKINKTKYGKHQQDAIYQTNKSISPTLMSGGDGHMGGAAAGYLKFKVGSQIRRLTPIECERLQGFSDDWTKKGKELGEISDSQRYKMCGNAVTVDVVEAVANKIKNAL